jgi:hypothetical protein
MNHTDASHTALLAEIADHLRVLSGFVHDLSCRVDYLRRTTSPYPYLEEDDSNGPDTPADDPPF